jgi:hypothetical protein
MNNVSSSRLEISALKKALISMKNTVFEGHNSEGNAANHTTGPAASNPKNKSIKLKALSKLATMNIGAKLVHISHKVDALAVQASDAVHRASTAEDTARTLQGQVEDAQCQNSLQQQTITDLTALVSGKAKQATLAQRLITLSDDVRTNKIAYLQQRRAVQVLRQEKRHLQSIISNIEADVMELEVSKVNSETRNVLFDIHDKLDSSNALLNLSSEDPLLHNNNNNNDRNGSGKVGKGYEGSAADFPQRQGVYGGNNNSNGSGSHKDLGECSFFFICACFCGAKRVLLQMLPSVCFNLTST